MNEKYELILPGKRMKAKYEQGDVIKSLDELVKQNYIYMNGKIYHFGWFMSWQLRMTFVALNNGSLHYANKKEIV